MKKSLLILGATAAFGLLASCLNSVAADPEPTPGSTEKHLTKAERKQADLEKYDVNKDGKLEKDERAARKADREAEKEAALLAKYDANHNGTLDPVEEAALKADKEKAAAKHAAHKAEKEAALLAKYDANHNGKLDPEEEALVQADKDRAAAEHAARPKRKRPRGRPDFSIPPVLRAPVQAGAFLRG